MQKMKQMSIVLFKHTLSAILQQWILTSVFQTTGHDAIFKSSNDLKTVYSRNCETETW